MKKPKLKIVRKVRLWVLYNPTLQLIVEQKKFKYELRVPSTASGLVVVEMTGLYVPTVTGEHSV